MSYKESSVKLMEAAGREVLVLDGAMGTMIQRYGLSENDFRGERYAASDALLKGCNDALVLTRPDVIKDIHRKYLEAGAMIIETDSFNANAVSLGDYGLQHDVTPLILPPPARRLLWGRVSTTLRPALSIGIC